MDENQQHPFVKRRLAEQTPRDEKQQQYRNNQFLPATPKTNLNHRLLLKPSENNAQVKKKILKNPADGAIGDAFETPKSNSRPTSATKSTDALVFSMTTRLKALEQQVQLQKHQLEKKVYRAIF